MKRQVFPTASKYRRRTRREFGSETVEYIIVILAVVVIGGGLMGSLSGLQGSYINCEVTLTVNGKSKTFVPKAICNGKVSDGIYVRPRIG